MRVLKIRSWKDFGWFCLDQVGHAAIVDLAVIWFASDWLDVIQAGAVILTIREGEQGRRTVKEWRKARDAVASNLPIQWDNRFATPLTDLMDPTSTRRQHQREEPQLIDLLEELHLVDRLADIVFGTLLAAGFFQVCRALGWL